MQIDDMLRILNVEPAQLPPARSSPARAEEAFARVGRTAQPCVSCGQPVTATRIVDVPDGGPRWVDTCTPHMIAITKTAATGAPESETLATLRAAVRQASVDAALLTAPLAEAECTRG
ncbi:hypothetical protein ACFWN5_03570 [Streptomyces sp. NPDC058430]|uniref:hypothetical protein n=1 Tax=unclassified Streptomyces TaxID=2593676 RepID=UPI0036348E50